MAPRLTYRRNDNFSGNAAGGAADGQGGLNNTQHNFPSAQSLNEEEIGALGGSKSNMKGQTTGEVGGTLFMMGDENPLENSRLE
jgi:hypothetical protein